MSIAVIIPLYNGERWIEETLTSVLAQTRPPKEVLVVDDGSQDGSVAAVRAFPSVKLLQNQDGKGGGGAGRARRLGLLHASSSFVAFLDQDDLWHPSHLCALSQILEQHPACPAACSTIARFWSPSAPEYDVCLNEIEEFDPWSYYPRNQIPSSSGVLIRRSALDRMGGWPNQYPITDILVWLKLTVESPMMRTNQITVGKREHEDSALRMLRDGSRALQYVRDYVQVCQEALAYRNQVCTNERQEDYQLRLNILRATVGILDGAITGDIRLIADSARALESSTCITEEDLMSLWKWVFWMLTAAISGATKSEQRLIFERVCQGWPDRYVQAQKPLSQLLTQEMSRSVFFSSLWRHPFLLATSPLFRESVGIEVKKVIRKAKKRAKRKVGG